MYREILPRLYPLRFHLETLTPFHAHEYKGAIFRGGFGQFFRDLVCITRVLPEKIPVLRKYPNAPHPFVMTPPLDARTPVPAGCELVLELTLIGRGIDSLAHFLLVFEEMGRAGRYGGRTQTGSTDCLSHGLRLRGLQLFALFAQHGLAA